MKKYSEIEPVSIYHVEYEPRIVVRRNDVLSADGA